MAILFNNKKVVLILAVGKTDQILQYCAGQDGITGHIKRVVNTCEASSQISNFSFLVLSVSGVRPTAPSRILTHLRQLLPHQRTPFAMSEVVNALVAFAVIVFIFRWATSSP